MSFIKIATTWREGEPMVGVWESGPDGIHKCPHCGALYEVTIDRFPMREAGQVKCDECNNIMKKWNSTSHPTFRLIKRPGD